LYRGLNSNYFFFQAKQRASIKWLLSKAYDHRTPEELREPFYKDHDDADHLKPHINRSLANAEFYCMALSVLYADPNFHNLNHWGIIQALARKGICVAEPSDCSLTESVLIQTAPLKMSAHMAVIEALMQLFIKEQVAVDRVLNTVKRFSAPVSTSEAPTDPDSALLLWSKRCCESLKLKIENEAEESEVQAKFPKVNDLSDLTDGVAITSVMALYCPEDLPWSSIALGDPPSMADSLYNIQLLQRFCKDSLPFNVCHLSIEDIVYMHDSIRLNVLAFLTDLFVGLEVKPVLRSIQLPGVKKDRIIEVPDPDLHRKNSPTGLKRLNSAIHQDQRSA
jgi:calmodulin-regulated spectrin-associated protein